METTIKIIKETDTRGDVYYWTMIGERKINCFSDLEKAEKAYEKLKERQKPIIEIIKEEKINL